MFISVILLSHVSLPKTRPLLHLESLRTMTDTNQPIAFSLFWRILWSAQFLWIKTAINEWWMSTLTFFFPMWPAVSGARRGKMTGEREESLNPEADADVRTAGSGCMQHGLCCLLLLQFGQDGELCWVTRGSSAACKEEQALTTSAVNLIIDRGRHGDPHTVTRSALSRYK